MSEKYNEYINSNFAERLSGADFDGDTMKLSKDARDTVEEMINLIRKKLDQLKVEGKLDEI